jgi:acyl-coenzyme A thioesterase PaaI-like protein
MDLDAARRLLETGIRFVQRSGLQVVELRRGYVRCVMPFRDNGNHIGTMYAGALFTLAETPGGALFLSSFDTVHFFPIVKDRRCASSRR